MAHYNFSQLSSRPVAQRRHSKKLKYSELLQPAQALPDGLYHQQSSHHTFRPQSGSKQLMSSLRREAIARPNVRMAHKRLSLIPIMLRREKKTEFRYVQVTLNARRLSFGTRGS